MFPYKSFFERHLWISYGLLAISIIGIFFIPWFNRWLKSKEEVYNNNLKLTYKYLIFDRVLLTEMGCLVEWRLRNSIGTDELIISFREILYTRLFVKLIGKPENPEWSDIVVDLPPNKCFIEGDEPYKYDVTLSQHELANLLKRYFYMTEAQSTIVWNGLRNKHEDLKNSNKLSIIETFVNRFIHISCPIEGGFYHCFPVSKYHLKLVWHIITLFGDDKEVKLKLQCSFDNDDVASKFPNYLDLLGMPWVSCKENKIFLDRENGLKNLLLRFGILSKEERGWIIDEVLSIKTAPEIRKTAYLLAQAKRTTDDNGLKILPDEICIKIAALTAEEGVDLETAEQVARNYLRRPKPYLWIN
jgi:hypothetical protein